MAFGAPNLQMNGWISVPWAHATGRGAGSDGVDGAMGHGPSGNQCTFTIQVHFSDVQQAIIDLCGKHVWNIGTGNLDRTLPKQHPIFPHLYVNRITSIKPVHFIVKTSQLLTSTWSSYDFVLLSILFTQPKYPIVSDAGLDRKFPLVEVPVGSGNFYRQEWQRFVEWTWQTGDETLSMEAGSMKYAEGTGTNQPTAGAAFNSPIGQYLGKPSLVAVWRQVPYLGLFSPTNYRPNNLVSALNTLNNVTYFNCPGATQSGTLRFTGWNFSFNEAPYPPKELGIALGGLLDLGIDTLWPSVTVDVQLVWSFFDPPHAHSSYRGHNLVPYRVIGNPDPQGSWYLATLDGNTTGAGIFPTTDPRLIFTYAV